MSPSNSLKLTGGSPPQLGEMRWIKLTRILILKNARFVIIYKPYRHESDELTAQALLYDKKGKTK